MKQIHNITITTFIDQEEDEKIIAEQIAQFLPENFADEKISIELENLKIEEGTDIKKIKVFIQKERHTKFVFKQLKENLGEEQCKTIVSQENRVDEQGKLFIRLDKKQFIEHDSLLLVDHGKCIHFSITIAAFPKKRSKALEVVKDLFA